MYIHSNTTCETLKYHMSCLVLLNTFGLTGSFVSYCLTEGAIMGVMGKRWLLWSSKTNVPTTPLPFCKGLLTWNNSPTPRFFIQTSFLWLYDTPVRDLYPTWPLLPTSSSHLSTYPSSCSQTRHNAPQPLTFVARTNPLRTGTPTRWWTVLRGGSRWLG